MTPPQPLAPSAPNDPGVRTGASWIYWIAGISAVNLIIELAGVDWGFMISLAAPMLIGSFAHSASELGVKIALGSIGFALCAVFALLGYYGGKGSRLAFVLALVFYAIDIPIWVVGHEWLAIALHAYAFFRILIGAQAAFALAKARKQLSGYQGMRGMQPPAAWPLPPNVAPPSTPTSATPPNSQSPFAQPAGTAPAVSPLSQSPFEPPAQTPPEPGALGPMPAPAEE